MVNLLIFIGIYLASFMVQAASCEDIHPAYRNRTGFGPFDFNDPALQKREKGTPLQLVEEEHFTDKVRSLKGGKTSQTPGGDLSYTLWAFPNHHAALLVLLQYTAKYKDDQPPEMANTTECYMNRAVQWRPDDPKVHLIFGMYLFSRKMYLESVERFKEAVRLNSNSGNAFYNLGLAYFEVKDYEKALDAAHMAYSLGFTLDGLKNKLVRANYWQDQAVKYHPGIVNHDMDEIHASDSTK